MENNLNEVLNISDENNTQENNIEKEIEKSDEQTLKIVANIILITGIISALILFCTIVIVVIPGKRSWENTLDFNSSGFVITIGVLITSITSWAFLRVISNISTSLKELNNRFFKK